MVIYQNSLKKLDNYIEKRLYNADIRTHTIQSFSSTKYFYKWHHYLIEYVIRYMYFTILAKAYSRLIIFMI